MLTNKTPNNDMKSDEDASAILDREFDSIDFKGSTIHVILGFGSSDIGKAELVARLGILLQDNFSILKFDGFLNTNLDGRFPSRTDHDFVVYRKFHNHIAYGGYNLILNGPFMIDFLNRFGEYKEHLMYCPHVAKFFARRIFENWSCLGKPKDLLVEIGGTFLDNAAKTYVIPALRMLKEFHNNIRLILLTGAGYNRVHIKAKPIMQALKMGQKNGIEFDLIFARLPSDFPSFYDLKIASNYIEQKIANSLIYSGKSKKVICIPYYVDRELQGYTEFLSGLKNDIFPKYFNANSDNVDSSMDLDSQMIDQYRPLKINQTNQG